jgi:hypothetical protein
MDVIVPSICLSSFAGAMLLYAGGRLTPRPAPEERPDLALSLELEAERAARCRAEEHVSGTRVALDEAVAALGQERARRTALGDELAGERAARARADAEAESERRRLADESARLRVQAAQAAELGEQLATLRHKVHGHSGDGGEVGRLRAALGAAEARAAGAEIRVADLTTEISRLRADVAKAVTAGKRLSAEAAGLRAKVAEQERAMAKLEAAVKERAAPPPAEAREAKDLAELQRRSVEVSMKLRTLEQRAAEMDRKEAENVDLRRRVEALATSAAEADELRRRLRDLEAQGYARRQLDGLHTLEDIPVSTGKPELETSLAAGLRELCLREPGCRAAVLSDVRGLLVAAYGGAGHRDELAAAASLTLTTAERLGELLPLGPAARMIVVDENAIVFGTRWLRWADECFLLSTLGVAEPADEGATGALRAQIEELIGAC